SLGLSWARVRVGPPTPSASASPPATTAARQILSIFIIWLASSVGLVPLLDRVLGARAVTGEARLDSAGRRHERRVRLRVRRVVARRADRLPAAEWDHLLRRVRAVGRLD